MRVDSITRLQMLDWLCAFCRVARARGNGWAFSYSDARYAPKFDRGR